MAVRVTGAEVLEIFETNMTVAQLEPFIEIANVMIDGNEDLLTLSDDLLDKIELLLSAHFASAYDQRISYQGYGESKTKFQGEFGKLLNSTDYGQRAILLDTTGTLQDISNGLQTASITAYPMDYPCTYATTSGAI
jgi:hypothetical protein